MNEMVKITAADFNPALDWENAWDGRPFDCERSIAEISWLIVALVDGSLVPHTYGGTDYAQWCVRTRDGLENAGPGDALAEDADGFLRIERGSNRYDIPEAQLARIVAADDASLAPAQGPTT